MKNKKTKIGLILILGLSALSFMSTVQGCEVIKRSFDDWFYEMNGVNHLNDNLGVWTSGQLIVWPQFGYEEPFISILDSDYHGHILEREMSDGRHMITVQIHVKGAPVTVETFDLDNYLVLFDGEMNYLFQLRFIINLTSWSQNLVRMGFDDDGFENDTGYIGLPAYVVISMASSDGFFSELFGVEFVNVIFIGTAKGVMVNDWNDLEAGDNAKLKVATLGFANRGYSFITTNIPPYIPIWSLDYLKLY